VLAAGLATVKVSEVDPPTPIPDAPNALLIVGGATMEIPVGVEFTVPVMPPPEMLIETLTVPPAGPVTFPVTLIGGKL